MSFLSSRQQDWRAGSAHALVFASVAGATTIVACVGGVGLWVGRGAFTDQHFTLGYYLGVTLTLLVQAVAILVPMVAICAVGLVLFGVPVSRRFEEKLTARWTAIVGLLWGGVAGGLFWAAVTGLVSDWAFDRSARFLVGVVFGAPTGFWWWLFYRRVLIYRSAVDN